MEMTERETMTLPARKRAVTEALQVAFTKGRSIHDKRRLVARWLNPDKYIQHSAGVPDGFEGLMSLVESLDDQFDTYSVRIHKMIAEEDHVFALCEYRFGSHDQHGKAIAEVFRFEGDLIVEHWDVIQDISAERANANSIF